MIHFFILAHAIIYNHESLFEFYPDNWIDLSSVECDGGVCTAWSRYFIDIEFDSIQVDRKFRVLCDASDSEILIDRVDTTTMSDGEPVAVENEVFQLDGNMVESLRAAVCANEG